jgi:hypothetical protein
MDRNKLKFVFAVHNHQPVGNFDHVISDCYEATYLPFLEMLWRFPRAKFSLHISGYLLEWLIGGGQPALDTIREMVRREQVEILTGTYYESIVPLISEDDAVNSIRAYTGKLRETFGVEPRGMWLAERVYEPYLPRVLNKAGVEYIALDDWHFITAGVSPDKLDRPWVARDGRYEVSVFPISKQMRYLVPFGSVDDVIGYLRRRYEDGDAMVCLADDGEKFGGWPGTHKHCYKDGWLSDFLSALDNAGDWLELATFGEAFDRLPKTGPAYLPNASYFEMGRWALSPDDQVLLENMGEGFNGDGEYVHLTPGAPFRSFLMKYPEINYLHKRMRGVSDRLSELEEGGSVYSTIRRSLWCSQANDAYWHGVFGGLYLPHLRRALYENMLNAEHAIDDEIGIESSSMIYDIDGDGSPEVILKNRALNAVVAPGDGLSLKELSDLERGICFTDTLARRYEPYHADLAPRGGEDGVHTIHDGMGSKEEGLERLLVYDKFPKRLFYDVLFNDATDSEGYFKGDIAGLERFACDSFTNDGNSVTGNLRGEADDSGVPVSIDKTIVLNQNGVSVEWRGIPGNGRRFGSELSLNFWSPAAEHSYLRNDDTNYKLNNANVLETVKKFALGDRLSDWEMVIESDRPVSLWYYPIYTISRSEGGYEKVFQGVTFFPAILLIPGEETNWALNVRIK